MDTSRVIDKLNEIIRHEWTGVAQYSQQAFLVSGPWREVYSDLFGDNAKESFKHAKLVGEKIVALGGIPSIERNDVHQTASLQEMLHTSLEFETMALRLYNECLDLVGDDDTALRVMLEDQCREEQDGVDHFTKLTRDESWMAQELAKADRKASAG
jgi:bacterioferritin